MRTTLDIDDDVLAVVKELARRERLSAGQIVSRCVRQAFTGSISQGDNVDSSSGSTSNITGFLPFPARGKLVANEEINRLREEEGL